MNLVKIEDTALRKALICKAFTPNARNHAQNVQGGGSGDGDGGCAPDGEAWWQVGRLGLSGLIASATGSGCRVLLPTLRFCAPILTAHHASVQPTHRAVIKVTPHFTTP